MASLESAVNLRLRACAATRLAAAGAAGGLMLAAPDRRQDEGRRPRP